MNDINDINDVHFTRADAGEEIFAWPGRLSNSEMIARHGFSFRENPVGIGRNLSQPPSWSDNKDSKGRKESWHSWNEAESIVLISFFFGGVWVKQKYGQRFKVVQKLDVIPCHFEDLEDVQKWLPNPCGSSVHWANVY